MDANDLLTLGLGLVDPWMVVDQELDTEKKPSELRLQVAADRGSYYPCPKCGELCQAHDFKELTWRHLNFFQHLCLIKARVPRVACTKHGVHRVEVPWARPGSGFTLLFEQMIMTLAREMPVATIAQYAETTDKRLWRVIQYYVTKAMEKIDLSKLESFGLDDTSSKRKHRYVTVFIDMDREFRPVVFAIEGRGKAAVKAFKSYVKRKKGTPDKVLEVVSDMSGSYIAAVQEHFPKADITVDWFHVVQLFTRAVDDTRRIEARKREMPDGSRWGVLKGRETTRTQTQEEALRELESEGFATGIAYNIKEKLRWIRRAETSHAAKWRATNFINYARRLTEGKEMLGQVRKAIETFERHLERILFRWRSWHTNARLEGFNGLFQAARARARGYRNVSTFITMIYLIGAPIRELLWND